MIRIDTLTYEASHGRKPRTMSGQASSWMFQLDTSAAVVQIRDTYPRALARAKKMARWSVRVLP